MCVKTVNRILLGLLMLVPGIVKLFVMKPSGVTAMLISIGFPMPMFLAWVLIFAEIIFGIAIIANWKIQYTVWPPMIILAVAVLTTVNWKNPMSASTILLHVVAISNYWLLSHWSGKGSMMHMDKMSPMHHMKKK